MASRAIIPLSLERPLQSANDIDDFDDGSSGRGIPIRAITRAVAVLREINRHGALNMTDIAASSKIPYPTACRIVQTLMHEELIERDDRTKLYRPTVKVTGLANGYDANAALSKIAVPIMEETTVRIGWPLSLTTNVGNSMILRGSTHSLTSLTFNEYQPGYSVPMLESASGLIYLANCNRSLQKAITSQMRRFGDDDTREMVHLAVEGGLLDTVKAEGYATRSYNRFTRNPGKTSSIAVPVIKDGQIRAALSVAFFAATIDLPTATKELVPELHACARAIADAL